MQKKIAIVAGARPNFMKVDPLIRALHSRNLQTELIHTGQHYDTNMSDIFFKELGIPTPDVHLDVGSASHAVQTANIMIAFEAYCQRAKPEWVVVAGDVNSTVACSLVAAKLGIKIAHLEAGLRSFDWTMPEEINRVVTDRLSDILLTPSPDGDQNLLREGIPAEKIYRVGNIMIDTVMRLLPEARKQTILEELKIQASEYILCTLHRPANVDSFESLSNVIEVLETAAESLPVIFPVHPRTANTLKSHQLMARIEGNTRIQLLEPQGYLRFLALTSQARLVLTDSGGIQEETTALGIPCLTLRENTERPITITEGTNKLVGTDVKKVLSALKASLESNSHHKDSENYSPPELWDGKTGERCADIFESLLSRKEPPEATQESAA